MKTPMILCWLLIFSTLAFAENTGDNFVVAGGSTYLCQEMRIGFLNTRIITTDGKIIKVPNHRVEAYRVNGHQYELLPLINFNGDTVDMAFMEFICTREGTRLYRYCSNCSKYDPLKCEIAPINRVYRYYILRDGQMKLLTEKDETSKFMSYFKVRVHQDLG